MNITCPDCRQPHTLFWLVKSKHERQLSYRCDRAEHAIHKPHGVELRTFTITRSVDANQFKPESLIGLHEEWTPHYRKQRQGEQQLQLTMMYGNRGRDR